MWTVEVARADETPIVLAILCEMMEKAFLVNEISVAGLAERIHVGIGLGLGLGRGLGLAPVVVFISIPSPIVFSISIAIILMDSSCPQMLQN